MKKGRGHNPESGDMTRRNFVKTSALAGFAIASSRSGIAGANVDTLKVGLLGCGGRGTGAAINMLEGGNNVRLVALADVFEDKIENTREAISHHENPEVRAGFDVDEDRCFVGLDAYRKILGTDIDILLEATLPGTRPRHLQAAMAAGKHIFSEKPMAADPHGIRKIMAAAKKHKQAGLSFVAGTQRRHQRDYIETVKKIRDGEIGDVIALRSYWCGGLPFARERRPGMNDLEYRIRNWYNYCWLCGDNIVEQHIHNIDVCNWVMGGPPKTVFSSGGRTWKPNEEKYGDIFDHFSCDFEYENGVHMFSFSRHWSNATEGIFEEVFATEGNSFCNDMGEEGINPYVQEHIDLVNSVTEEGPHYHEAERVCESTLTAIIGRMSAYTGQRVSYSRALSEGLKIGPDKLDFSLSYPTGPVPTPGAPGEED